MTASAISVVLIVKNEEAMLTRCLDSVVEADEIVVCDTGSADLTVKIAEKYGATVVHFPWCDDFAAARNFAKSHAQSEWVLSIDADEMLTSGVNSVRKAIAEATGNAISVKMFAEGSGHRHDPVRLFRRELDWVGAAHETLSSTATDHSDVELVYGWSPAHHDDPDRMLRILSNLTAPRPRDLYYLAREHYYRANWDEAVAVLQRYLDVAEWMPERADGWLMLARCLWKLQRGSEARTACAQAIVNNAHFREALEFMAEMSWPENSQQWRAFAELADNRNVLFVRSGLSA